MSALVATISEPGRRARAAKLRAAFKKTERWHRQARGIIPNLIVNNFKLQYMGEGAVFLIN